MQPSLLLNKKSSNETIFSLSSDPINIGIDGSINLNKANNKKIEQIQNDTEIPSEIFVNVFNNENHSPPPATSIIAKIIENIPDDSASHAEMKTSSDSSDYSPRSFDIKSRKMSNFFKKSNSTKYKDKGELTNQRATQSTSESVPPPKNKSPRINFFKSQQAINKVSGGRDEFENFEPLKRYIWLENPVEISTFDATLKFHLAKVLKEINYNLSDFKAPDKLINEYCFKFMYSFFYLSKESYKAFREKKEELSCLLYEELLNPAILMEAANAKLIKVREELKCHFLLNYSKTEWSAEIYYYIENLIQAKEFADIKSILEKIENLPKGTSSNSLKKTSKNEVDGNHSIKNLIYNCLGRYVDEAELLVKLIKKWASSSPKDLKLELKKHLKTLANLFENAKNISSNEFLTSSRQKQIEFDAIKITPCQIHRSWIPDGFLIFEKVMINGQTLCGDTCSLKSSGSESASLNEVKATKFYLMLFRTICNAGLAPEISEKNLKNLVIRFTKEINLGVDSSYFSSNKDILSDIFLILKASTVEFMGPAYDFLLELFPNLFSLNFSKDCEEEFFVNYKSGIVCDISVTSKESFQVKQTRKACIFVTENLNQPVAEIDISWTLVKNSTGWEGKLAIPNWTVNNLAYWVPLVRILTSNQT